MHQWGVDAHHHLMSRATMLVALALVAAGASTALLFGTARSHCNEVTPESALLLWGVIVAAGALLAGSGVFLALTKQSTVIRSAVAVWAVLFYVPALLAVNFILSWFVHCPPN
jgi:hypothetical protein